MSFKNWSDLALLQIMNRPPEIVGQVKEAIFEFEATGKKQVTHFQFDGEAREIRGVFSVHISRIQPVNFLCYDSFASEMNDSNWDCEVPTLGDIPVTCDIEKCYISC